MEKKREYDQGSKFIKINDDEKYSKKLERDPKDKIRKKRSRSRDRQRRKSRSNSSGRKQNRKRSRSESKSRSRSRSRREKGRRTYKKINNPRSRSKSASFSPSHTNIEDNNKTILQNTSIRSLSHIRPNDNIRIEEKEKPNFEASGLLAKQTNLLNGIVLKFTQPLDAASPQDNWRLYTFKKNRDEDIFHIDKKPCYLLGKDEDIADIILSHPSASRQHAVIQFRKKEIRNSQGSITTVVKPYLMDLESTNGTFLNKEKIESARYYELIKDDVINFGFSERDYVVMK